MRTQLAITAVALFVLTLVSQALEPLLRVSAEVVRERKSRATDWDDRAEQLQFAVKLTNADTMKSADGLTAKIWVFGESTSSSNQWRVFSIDQKDLVLPARGQDAFHTTSVSHVYDNSGSVKYGYKYSGWVLLIRDASGKIVFTKASADRFLRNLDKLDGLKAGTFYDRDFKPIEPVSGSF